MLSTITKFVNGSINYKATVLETACAISQDGSTFNIVEIMFALSSQKCLEITKKQALQIMNAEAWCSDSIFSKLQAGWFTRKNKSGYRY